MAPGCARPECGGVAVADHAVCWGHLTDEQFVEAVRALDREHWLPVNMTYVAIDAARVQHVLEWLSGSDERVIQRPVDLRGAEVFGDVWVRDVRLAASMIFQTKSWEGTLYLRSATRLENVLLHKATIEGVHVADCHGEQERLEFKEAKLGSLDVERCSLRHLGVLGSNVTQTVQLHDVALSTLTALFCAVRAVSLKGVRTSGSVELRNIVTTDVRLSDCSFGGWTDVSLTAPLYAHQCSFEGPFRLGWTAVEGDPGFRVPEQVEAQLRLHSVRFESNAAIAWCGAEVELEAALFSAASTLDRAADWLRRPVIANVKGLDGEHLRFAEVDLRNTRLAEATRLGPIDVGQLRFGTGEAGITRRHFIADEFGEPVLGGRARTLSHVYRDLRTSAEAVGSFSGANDLHYGERLWQRKASATWSVEWLWLTLYGLVGYGVRPWRPLAGLVALIVATALALGAVDGLEKARVVDGTKTETTSVLCARDAVPRTPERRQQVTCDADFGERLDFAARSSTSLIRPAAGYEVRRAGTAIEVVGRLGAALLFGLFVLAMRNRLRR